MYHLTAYDCEAEYFGSQLNIPSLTAARATAQQWLTELPDDIIIEIRNSGDIGGDVVEEAAVVRDDAAERRQLHALRRGASQGGGWWQGCGAAHMMRSFQTSEVRSSCASHSTAPIDRWFVGSSRSKRSGRANIAAASAARTRQPPESAEHGRASSSGEKPRFCSSLVARSSTESAPISSRRSWTACGGAEDR